MSYARYLYWLMTTDSRDVPEMLTSFCVTGVYPSAETVTVYVSAGILQKNACPHWSVVSVVSYHVLNNLTEAVWIRIPALFTSTSSELVVCGAR